MSARLVIGLGFGDEGKGTVVDHLTATSPRKPLVVRFSGGAQAAHNVIHEDGFQHTFSQFGSGTLRSARTLLSRYVLVDPLRLYSESLPLSGYLGRNSLELLAVDERAPLVTRIHAAVNHARERARGDARHGSTGLGMGETEFYRLQFPHAYPMIGDLKHPLELAEKLTKLYEWATSEVGELGVPLDAVIEELTIFGEDEPFRILSAREVREALWSAEELLFEGSQGVLLDEWVGFHPHTTWSTVTPDNALSLLREAGLPTNVERIGVTRTYSTRHGAGPFPTEDNSLGFPELHNGYGEFQGAWRVGTLDLTLLRYAARVVRPTGLAITHMDVAQEHVALEYDDQLDFSGNIANAQDKIWQERFTERLSKQKPGLLPIAGNDAVKRLIEETCEAQAQVLSFGPSADAKRVL